MNRTHRLSFSVALGAALLTALAFVAGCSSGARDDSSTGSSGDSSASDSVAGATALTPDANLSKTTGEVARGAVDVEQRAVIAKGSLEITTKSVDDVRRRARDIATTADGVVADEQTDSDSHGRAESVHLVLRVPVGRFDAVLDDIARLGRLEHRTQTAEDVTTQVIDNAARVRAQRASVASIERLYARATTIGEVMSIEAQLSKRQAALDSLERQQRWLADQTSLSTITLTISRTPTTHAAPAAHHHNGFVSGLDNGWDALSNIGHGVLVTLGAVLPFGAVAVLIGIPVWLTRRRRRPVTEEANG